MSTEPTATIDARPVHDRVRKSFDSGITRPVEWRRDQINAISSMLEAEQDRFLDALADDLGRPHFEGYLADVAAITRDNAHIVKHLARWMRDEKVRPGWEMAAMRTKIRREPLGSVLIIGPWNYPVQLVLMPLAAALAAGNTAVLKPSELAPAVSAALADLVPRYLDPDAVAVVEGGVDETTALLAEQWDHIFYTGNGRVGRIVMEAAARHLTPVTLELGGKSPTIVTADAPLGKTAGRISFGKWLNAAQTCIAPDYVLVERSAEGELLDQLKTAIERRYGSDPRHSPDYGRIVNERHFDRLSDLLDGGGYDSIVCGGERDRDERYLAPTVLAGVQPDAPVMQDEIFGPILPVLTVDSVDEAIHFVNDRDKPLALYVFTRSSATADKVLAETSSGGACVNDTVTHAIIPALPFGGVGPSGTGAYRGRAGFEELSHHRAVLDRPWWFDLPVLNPPYTGFKEKLIRRLF